MRQNDLELEKRVLVLEQGVAQLQKLSMERGLLPGAGSLLHSKMVTPEQPEPEKPSSTQA